MNVHNSIRNFIANKGLARKDKIFFKKNISQKLDDTQKLVILKLI